MPPQGIYQSILVPWSIHLFLVLLGVQWCMVYNGFHDKWRWICLARGQLWVYLGCFHVGKQGQGYCNVSIWSCSCRSLDVWSEMWLGLTANPWEWSTVHHKPPPQKSILGLPWPLTWFQEVYMAAPWFYWAPLNKRARLTSNDGGILNKDVWLLVIGHSMVELGA